jgi:hypothetical protein
MVDRTAKSRPPLWQRLDQQEKMRGGNVVRIGGEVQGFTENSLSLSQKQQLTRQYEKQSCYYETLKKGDYKGSPHVKDLVKLNRNKQSNKLL